MTKAEPNWSYRLAREEIPEQGLHVDLVADEEVRAALVKSAGLRELPRLAASFDVTRTGLDGLHIVGEVTSTIGQECVVTLEPIDQNLLEPIDLIVVPQGTGGQPGALAEASLVGDEPDIEEPLPGGAVDLGAIATEYFLLGIDPYPRKPGAVFEPPSVAEPSTNPFAALASLKKSKPGDGA